MASRSKSSLSFIFIVLLAVGLTTALVWGAWSIDQDRAARYAANSQSLQPSAATTARVARVRMIIGSRGVLTYGISRFKLRAGHYPDSLTDLFRRPDSLSSDESWNGPYLSAEGLLIDPWEHAYSYRWPGLHNSDGYDLWSLGPDGQDDSGDEIGNWDLAEEPEASAGPDTRLSSLAADWDTPTRSIP